MLSQHGSNINCSVDLPLCLSDEHNYDRKGITIGLLAIGIAIGLLAIGIVWTEGIAIGPNDLSLPLPDIRYVVDAYIVSNKI